MNENKEYKGVAQTFETRYVIMQFHINDLRYNVSMPNRLEFKTPLDAQTYMNRMGWNTSNRMIVPVVREVLV